MALPHGHQSQTHRSRAASLLIDILLAMFDFELEPAGLLAAHEGPRANRSEASSALGNALDNFHGVETPQTQRERHNGNG